VSPAGPGSAAGPIEAWLNPVYGGDARTGLAIQAESQGFPTVWLGFGRAPAIQVLTGNGNDPVPANRQVARLLLSPRARVLGPPALPELPLLPERFS
jgi:hypothetical protein